jgi:hypothetical protein
MSTDSLEVGAISSAILGADDFSLLVGLYPHEHLIVLGRQKLDSFGYLHDRALRRSSIQE